MTFLNKLYFWFILLISFNVSYGKPDKIWKDMVSGAKYVAVLDIGEGQEFQWVSARHKNVTFLLGDADDSGSFFINLSKSGKMVVIGHKEEEVMLGVDAEESLSALDGKKIVKISLKKFRQMIQKMKMENGEEEN